MTVQKEKPGLYEILLDQRDKDAEQILALTKECNRLRKDILEGAITFENEKKALNKQLAEVELVKNSAVFFLGLVINQFEGQFNSDEKIPSPEYGTEILAIYKFLEANGVDYNCSHPNSVYNRVQEAIDNWPMPVSR